MWCSARLRASPPTSICRASTAPTASSSAASRQATCSGRSVASAGDVNGDGFADLIVGALGADPNGIHSGASYVVFGKAVGLCRQYRSLDASTARNGFKLSGAVACDFSGCSVASAGDVNGDGFADLIVGASAPIRTAAIPARAMWCSARLSGFAAKIELSMPRRHKRLQAQRCRGLRPQRHLGRLGRRRQRRRLRRRDHRSLRRRSARPPIPARATWCSARLSGFAANIDLSSLDGTNGFRLDGVAACDFSGCLGGVGRRRQWRRLR